MARFNKFETPEHRKGWLAQQYIDAACNLMQDKKYKIADQCVREGVSAFPENGRLTNMLGRSLRARREDDKALELFQRAVDLNPHDIISRIDLADFLGKMKRVDDAVREFLVAIRANIQKNSTPEPCLHKLGHCYFLNGLYQDAANSFGLCLDINPGNEGAKRRLQEIAGAYGAKPSYEGMKQLASMIADGIPQKTAPEAPHGATPRLA